MKLISIALIQISSERQRRDFNAAKMQELVEDIRENGLFNAIVLRESIESDKTPAEMAVATALFDSSFCRTSLVLTLCQGERRLRAIQDIWDLGGTFTYDGTVIPRGQVPYVTLGDLDPLQAEICELAENLCREGLSWQEEAAAVSRIMKLRTEQALNIGDAPPSIATITREVKDVPVGLADGELGSYQDSTRKAIRLADMLDDPEIRAAKTQGDAWKIAKRKEQTARHEALAESVGRTFSAASHTLLNEDSLVWMQSASAGQFDVILTDPPYGMNADEFGDAGGHATNEHNYADDVETFTRCAKALFQHSLLLCKPQAHLYVFCDIDQFWFLRTNLSESGWKVHRTPLVWHKTDGNRVPWANPPCGPRRRYELILYAVKGQRQVTNIAPDVLVFPSDQNLGHSAQKPVALYAELLKRSIRPGDKVLDPFAGSGPILPAAHGLKCLATAIEQDAAAFGLMVKRAKELK